MWVSVLCGTISCKNTCTDYYLIGAQMACPWSCACPPPLLACHWRLGRGYTCAISFSHHRYNIFSVRHRRPHGHQFHYCAPLLKYILSIDWLIEYAHISLLSLKVEHSNLLGLSYKISKLLKFILSMDHFKYFTLFLK